jgi:Family of unknown function (DUF5706)
MIEQRQATESAWRIHEALMDWTGKVDAKATVVLSLESAVVTALAALSGNWPLPAAGRCPTALVLCYWTGVGLLVLSVAISVLVVLPRLGRGASGRRWRDGYVYFGHLRHWETADLVDAMRVHDILPVLARQLIAISRICWRKHRLVQVSIALACGGTVLVAVRCMIA